MRTWRTLGWLGLARVLAAPAGRGQNLNSPAAMAAGRAGAYQGGAHCTVAVASACAAHMAAGGVGYSGTFNADFAPATVVSP